MLTITKKVKSISGTGTGLAGEVITYDITVCNTGTANATGVVVTDANATITAGSPIAVLAAGSCSVVTATHQITPAEAAAGSVKNSASATGTGPNGEALSAGPTPTVDTPVGSAPNAVLSITKTVKSISGTGRGLVGETITYAFNVCNTGTATATNVTVTDTNATVVGGPIASLAAGACDATTISATHLVTAADATAGSVVNLATASGTGPNGAVSSPPSSLVTTIVEPALTIVKSQVSVSGTGAGLAGEVITYSFKVCNTGVATATNVIVQDASATVTGGPLASLAAGACDTTTFSATHTITAAEAAAGSFTNSATTTGTGPNGPVTSTPSSVTTPTSQGNGQLSVTKTVKSISGTGKGLVGETITYAFNVCNTGTATLTNVNVTDNNATVSGGPIASLAPGACDATTITATHVITAADAAAGSVKNSATATGTGPNGPVTSPPTPPVTTPVEPALTIVKSVKSISGTGLGLEGETITYSFKVCNTGNAPATNVTVADANATVTGGPIASLAAGACDTTTFSATHVITAAEAAAGSVTNTATASGTGPNGPITSSPSSTTTTVCGSPVCYQVGTCLNPTNDPSFIAFMDVWYVHQTPSGSVELIDAYAKNVPPTASNGWTTFNGGGSMNGQTISQAMASGNVIDWENGYVMVLNPATNQEELYYWYNGTYVGTWNPGYTTLVNGPLAGLTLTQAIKTPPAGYKFLGQGEDGLVWMDPNGCLVTYYANILYYIGTVFNACTVTGDTVNGNISDLVNDPRFLGVSQLQLNFFDPATCTFQTNYWYQGIQLWNGDASDLCSSCECWTCCNGTCTALKSGATATQASIAASGTPHTPCPCVAPPPPPKERLYLAKTATVSGSGLGQVGETITWHFEVKNNGANPITNITINDPSASVTGGPIASLAPGASDTTTFTATHVITAADLAAGSVQNTATANGTSVDGPISSSTAVASVQIVEITCYAVNPDPSNQPHACEYVCQNGVKNPAFMTIADGYYVMKDPDGSISLYYGPSRSLAANYTWTTFTGGGPLNGMTIAQAQASGMVADWENGYVNAVDPATGQMYLYPYSTGTYAGPYGPAGNLVGGPLAGSAPLSPPAGWKFLGTTDSHYYYMSPAGCLVAYYHSIKQQNAGITTCTLNSGPFAGPLANAVNAPCFLGVFGEYLVFIDPATNNTVWYDYAGNLALNTPGQPLLPACECWTCTGNNCVRKSDGASSTKSAVISSGGTATTPCPCA